jgi:hypothetical protein
LLLFLHDQLQRRERLRAIANDVLHEDFQKELGLTSINPSKIADRGRKDSYMEKRAKKKKFEVADNETIEQCLERMKREGYTPIRRIEEPIFQEIKKDGKLVIEPCGRKIIFEGKLQ